MSKIVVSLYKYKPTVASTIRVMAFIKEFLSQGNTVLMVTTCDESIDIISDRFSVVLYSEAKFKPTAFSKIINDYRLVRKTKSVYRRGDIIYSYTVPLFGFLFKKHWNVFYEETEVPLYGDRTHIWNRLSTKLRLNNISRSSGLIVISQALKEYYIKEGIGSSMIMIANMTVDVSRFEGLEKQAVSKPYIAYCGGVSNRKDGVDVLIRAFAKVADYSENLQLYIIGSFVSSEDEAYDKMLVESLNIKSKVCFMGRVSSDLIPQLLKNAQCLVLARPISRQAMYGFPTKLGEYLLTSNPVVVTKVGEIPLYLKHKKDAYLAQPGDVDDLASCILDAITSTDANQIGVSGFNVALENFNSKIESKKLLEFFRHRSGDICE